MSDAQVCTVDDGLINPAALPAKSADLDTTTITGAAADLRTMGTTVDTTADEIKSIWSGLGACYRAPEQAEVYALMDGPATASEKVKTTFASMAGHLDTYADELEKIKTKLSDFEKRAQAFRDRVIDGVWVNATEAADANLLTYGKAFLDGISGNDQDRKKVNWNEDGATREENEGYLNEIAGIYAEVSAAAATCATSINGLTSIPDDEKKITPLEERDFTNPDAPMPWGYVGDEDRNCVESVGHGAYQFGKNTVEGLGQLISYNPETGDWGDWEHAGQAWMGTGNVLLSLAVSLSPTTQMLNAALKLSGQGDSEISKWIDERNKTSAGLVTGLVGIDLEADDPFHKWKEDGIATLTESALNVGTMFIPGAGQAGAAVKVAGFGSRVLKVGGAVADFAVPGGSWLLKGGMHTIPVLKTVVKFGDNLPTNLLDDVAKPGLRAPNVNPVSVADDVVPAGTRPAKPVTNDLFGDGPEPVRPDAAAPRTTTADPELPPDRTPTGAHTDAAEAPRVVELSSVGAPSASGSATHAVSDAAHHVDAGARTPAAAGAAHHVEGSAASRPAATGPARPDLDAEPARPGDPDGAPRSPERAEGEDPTDGGHRSGDGGVDDRPEQPSHASPDESPGHPDDTHHAPDSDGSQHRSEDPPGTQRDANGVLRDEKGQFAADTPDADLPVQRAEKGASQDFTIDDPVAQTDHRALLGESADAVTASRRASLDLHDLAQEVGVPLEPLKKRSAEVAATITDWVKSGRIDAAAAQRLTDAVSDVKAKALALKKASEALGDHATAALVQQRGQISLIADTGSSSGRFDHVAVGMDDGRPHLTIYESKGGGSPLGLRKVDGVMQQQGTAAYANAIAKVDPRLAAKIAEFIENNPGSPITEALKRGDIPVRYELVRARGSGSTTVTPFVLDAKIELPKAGG